MNKIGLVKYFDLFINKSKKDPYGGFVLVGPQISPSHYKPNFKILLPKESYVESQKFIFDKVNFIVSQKYSMQIGYEQNEVNKFENIEVWKGIVNSNELTIFVHKCGIK